jgi:2-polyprenyl-3-methyl-5-hydroxy-6-metoxy-1,4-benzoquinol methylase
MLISENYRALMERLHDTHQYGERGNKWADMVLGRVELHKPNTILDYGCGKGALKRTLAPLITVEFREYDPAISEKNEMPEVADLVICTDVLEHIEPNCIEAVVDHLKKLARRVLFVVVSTRPAVKFLEDGRNAHLIVQSMESWHPLLVSGMHVLDQQEMNDEFTLTMAPIG